MKRRAKPSKKVRKVEISPSELIRSALSRCRKAELIDFLVDFSKQYLEVRRELEARLNVEKPVIKAVQRAGGEQAKQWAAEMIRADAGGFICDTELERLAESKS